MKCGMQPTRGSCPHASRRIHFRRSSSWFSGCEHCALVPSCIKTIRSPSPSLENLRSLRSEECICDRNNWWKGNLFSWISGTDRIGHIASGSAFLLLNKKVEDLFSNNLGEVFLSVALMWKSDCWLGSHIYYPFVDGTRVGNSSGLGFNEIDDRTLPVLLNNLQTGSNYSLLKRKEGSLSANTFSK